MTPAGSGLTGEAAIVVSDFEFVSYFGFRISHFVLLACREHGWEF
jgi:hypothetical protein